MPGGLSEAIVKQTLHLLNASNTKCITGIYRGNILQYIEYF